MKTLPVLDWHSPESNVPGGASKNKKQVVTSTTRLVASRSLAMRIGCDILYPQALAEQAGAFLLLYQHQRLDNQKCKGKDCCVGLLTYDKKKYCDCVGQ